MDIHPIDAVYVIVQNGDQINVGLPSVRPGGKIIFYHLPGEPVWADLSPFTQTPNPITKGIEYTVGKQAMGAYWFGLKNDQHFPYRINVTNDGRERAAFRVNKNGGLNVLAKIKGKYAGEKVRIAIFSESVTDDVKLKIGDNYVTIPAEVNQCVFEFQYPDEGCMWTIAASPVAKFQRLDLEETGGAEGDLDLDPPPPPPPPPNPCL
ncbi:MAG: hypothetical protein QNK37_16315 [Acidobacteriota bacterium]|nr:hypothetical protein [Acidobacteriota bacterium]